MTSHTHNPYDLIKPSARLCPWCTCRADASLSAHDESCDRKIMAQSSDEGQNKNTVPALENKIKNIMIQLNEYESTLRLIAAPRRPDGTYNRDRDACRLIAENILRAYKSHV